MENTFKYSNIQKSENVKNSAISGTVYHKDYSSYDFVHGGKNKMSLLVALKNRNGIAMAADSRLMRNRQVLNDETMKVFKSAYFVLGVTGSFDVYSVDKDKQETLQSIESVIADGLKTNEYCSHQEFLDWLEYRLGHSFAAINEPDYNFLFGYKENGDYILHFVRYIHNGERIQDEYYHQNLAFAMGIKELVPTVIGIHADWDINRMEQVASETVRHCIELSDLYAIPSQVGGMIHTEYFV